MLKKIFYSIYFLQEQFLRKKLSKTLNASSNSKRKRHYQNGCTVDLNCLADSEKNLLEEKLNLILSNSEYSTEKILKYIKKQGTQIFYIKNANKLLAPIGENVGFVLPQKGHKALYLSIVLGLKLSLKTDACFVLTQEDINIYCFIYHIYNWFAFNNNIAGIDTESQFLLRKYLGENSDTTDLQLQDIYKLKDAIEQDKAAIDFVVKICKRYEGSKNAIKTIKEKGSAIL